MDSKRSKLSTALTSFWFFSSVSILISLAIAIWVYRLKFGGVLSNNSADWSNFGSYMGGIFGPLVSFVTLLAVLKTVYLQRELLDTQSKEFDRMNQLQQQTFDASLNQMTSAASDARKLQVSASQDTAIKVIDQHLSIFDRSLTRQNEILYKLMDTHNSDLSDEGRIARKDIFDNAIRRKNKASSTIDRLAELSTAMAVTDYRTSDQVRKELLSGLDKIKNDIDEKYGGE
jgi:hypothetical protein